MTTPLAALTLAQRRVLAVLTRMDISYPLDTLARMVMLPQFEVAQALTGLDAKRLARKEESKSAPTERFRATDSGRAEMTNWARAENRVHAAVR